MRIYLDNAATSFPKAPGVKEAVCAFMESVGASPGRSAHALSIESGRILYQARRGLADLLGLEDCKRVFFTHNATMAINTLLQGFLRANDVVVTTQMEHNALMRPLNALKTRLNLEIRQIPCAQDGTLDLESARELLKGAKLLACAHINNVSGAMIPLEELSALARNEGVAFLLDGAQSVGCVDMRNVMEQVDFLALSAHKGLLSPMGVGALLVGDSVAFKELEPLIYGGTGSASYSLDMPAFYPDMLEAGTLNYPAIVALGEGVLYLKPRLYEHIDYMVYLTEMVINGLAENANVRVYSRANPFGIVAFDVEGLPSEEVAARLSSEYSVCVRAGLHCAPLMHGALGSSGLVRASLSPFNTKGEALYFLKAVAEVASRR